MARRYAALVDGRAATDRYRNGIVGGKEICTFETTAFTDVDLAREMPVVRIFVFRKSPFFCCFAEVGGQFGVVLGEPEKAFGVFTQTLGELVAPFPRRGGPGPVLLRQVGRYEHTVLVIGVRLHVRDMDDVGDLGDPPFVSRKFGRVAGLDMFPVLFHHFGCHALHGGIRVASGPDVLHNGGIVFAVIMGRLGESHTVRRIIGQTEAVIVRLHGIVFLERAAVPFRTAPIFVDTSGSGLAELVFPFAPYAERNTGGSAEVTFVGGIQEYRTGVFLHFPGFAVQDTDLFDAVVAHDYVFIFGIELAHGQDRDLVLLPVEHLLEDACPDGGFEVVAVAAYFHLLGARTVGVDIVLFHSVHKLTEQAGRCGTGGDVGCSESVGGKSAYIAGTFEYYRFFPHPGSRDGCHDPSGVAADDHQVVGRLAESGRTGQKEGEYKCFLSHKVLFTV